MIEKLEMGAYVRAARADRLRHVTASAPRAAARGRPLPSLSPVFDTGRAVRIAHRSYRLADQKQAVPGALTHTCYLKKRRLKKGCVCGGGGRLQYFEL